MKTFTTVNLLVHGSGSNALVLEDYVDDNGEFVNIGAQVADAIEKKRALHYVLDGDELYLPYHSIVNAIISREEGEYTEPEDDFCKPVCETKESFTIVWMNGEDSLGTEVYPKGAIPSYKGTEPTKDGYVFRGFSDDPTGAPLSEFPPVTESATYYAIFGGAE